MSEFDLSRLGRSLRSTVQVFVLDALRGLWAISHHALVLFGLAAVCTAILLGHRADLRKELEIRTLGWLQSREVATRTPNEWAPVVAQNQSLESQAVLRATAADPSALDMQQAAVAHWLARRYRVAPEPISRLVQEAWVLGKQSNLDPTLILAVMAIESGFNPFAESPVGAQGLMQVMTHLHDEKYVVFGGQHAAFDPVANLRVGVRVLKDCIGRAGSLQGGLKYYVGAANLATDGGYGAKVLAERARLRNVAAGSNVPITTPLTAATLPTPEISSDDDISALPASVQTASATTSALQHFALIP